MKKINFILLLAILLLASCWAKKNKEPVEWAGDVKCVCPPTIFIQPYDDFTQAEANALVPKIKASIVENAGIELDVEVLPNKQLSEALMNKAKTRYRADKIIQSIEDNRHDVTIAVTHKDISCTHNGKKDWGVLGLSFKSRKYVCVVSDFRLKNKKRDLWKVAIHEFFHTYCNMDHCPDDNATCIIKDAKGHADFSNKEHLCAKCKAKCII